jgi:anti-repressor protein
MVEYYDAVKSAVNCQTMEQVAKKYGVGTHTLFKLLRESKVLRSTLDYPPYQQYIDSGHFKVEGRVYQVDGKVRQYNAPW